MQVSIAPKVAACAVDFAVDLAAIYSLANMDELPNEVLFKIISSLDLHDVVAVSQVSTRYRELTSENSLWKELFDRNFALPFKDNLTNLASWRNVFKIHFQIDNNLKRGICKQPLKIPKRAARLNTDIQAFFTSVNGIMEDSITLLFPFELSISRVVVSVASHTKFGLSFYRLTVISSGLIASPTQHLDFHMDDILTIEANSRIMASSSLDNLVNVCDLQKGTLLHVLEGHNKPVNCMQIDVNQDLLVTADVEGIIKLWMISAGKCLHTLTGHKDEICCMKQKGPWIITGSHDKTVRVWSTSGEALHELVGHTGYINCVAFDFVEGEETGFVVSGDRHGTIRVWNLHNGAFLHLLPTNSLCEICCLDFDLETTTSVFTASDGSVWRFDVISQVTIRAESRHQNIAYAMHWSKAQNRMITAGYDGAVIVWDTSGSDLKICKKIDIGPQKFFWLEVSPCNRFVVLATRSKEIYVLDFSNGEAEHNQN